MKEWWISKHGEEIVPNLKSRWVSEVPIEIKTAEYYHVIDKLEYDRLNQAFEYLISRLPEECTAGFVTHARAIASGDLSEIERTK